MLQNLGVRGFVLWQRTLSAQGVVSHLFCLELKGSWEGSVKRGDADTGKNGSRKVCLKCPFSQQIHYLGMVLIIVSFDIL